MRERQSPHHLQRCQATNQRQLSDEEVIQRVQLQNKHWPIVTPLGSCTTQSTINCLLRHCLVRRFDIFDIDHRSSEVGALQSRQCQVFTNNPSDQQPDKLRPPDPGDKTRDITLLLRRLANCLLQINLMLCGGPVVVPTWNSRGNLQYPHLHHFSLSRSSSNRNSIPWSQIPEIFDPFLFWRVIDADKLILFDDTSITWFWLIGKAGWYRMSRNNLGRIPSI